MQEFEVLSPIIKDGQVLEVGSTIQLPSEQAFKLMNKGVIGFKENKTEKETKEDKTVKKTK